MPTTQLFALDGKTVVVTGGAGWIGSALCEGLGAAGAHVYIVDINEQRVEERLSKLREAGIRCSGLIADVMADEPARSAIDRVVTEAGRIDVLVNCAYKAPKPEIDDTTSADMQKGFEAATGYFVTAQQASLHMRKAGGGSIVNIGSMYGHVTGYPDVYRGLMPANPLPYQAAKAAVHHMTRYMAVYWAEHGIRVNAVAPGPIPNPGAAQYAHSPEYAEFADRLRTMTPLHRLGTPSDIAGPVVFLASDASSFMTGQTLFVDGGWTVW